MTVPVHFPDGAVRQVPAQLRQITPSHGIAGATFEQVPLNCDPLWRYDRTGDRWVAARRPIIVPASRPAAEDWWVAIASMADEQPGTPAENAPELAMRPAA